MKHLTDEEKLAALEGQGSDTANAHLAACAECAADIERWRRTTKRLSDFAWPVRRRQRSVSPAPIVKWALAASVAICIGFAAGHASTPNPNQLRAQIKSEIQQEMLAALSTKTPAPDEFARQFRVNLDAAMMRMTTAPNTAETQRAVLATLTEMREQQAANYLSLRKDLETLAANADQRLQVTRRQILELAASATEPTQ